MEFSLNLLFKVITPMANTSSLQLNCHTTLSQHQSASFYTSKSQRTAMFPLSMAYKSLISLVVIITQWQLIRKSVLTAGALAVSVRKHFAIHVILTNKNVNPCNLECRSSRACWAKGRNGTAPYKVLRNLNTRRSQCFLWIVVQFGYQWYRCALFVWAK